MKKTSIFLLLAIVASSSVCYAQKVQSYSGSKSYTTTVGYIPGTEKYSYIIDERGSKVFHGTYSFVGKDQYNDDTRKYVANYNFSANYKQGNLNGTYSVNETIEGKVWKFIKGWIPFSASAKLTATFADGKPAGTFTAIYKDAMNYHGTVTMKNSKYIGAYDYYGEGYKSLWEIKGQLTDNGKLVGKWKVRNITGREEWDMVFENDVLISKDDKKNVTPPAVQAIAKQFAAGKLTEEQVKDQGYIVKKDSLPLDNFISYLLLLDDDDFAFGQIKGWDFSDYKAKEYWEIEKPNIISDEGLNILIKRAENANRAPEGQLEDNDYGWCIANPFYNTQYSYYYIDCHSSFNKKYGYYTNTLQSYVVLTPSQYKKLISVQDSVAIVYNWQFSTPTYQKFIQHPLEAQNALINSKDLRAEEQIELNKAFLLLSERLSGEHKSLIEEDNRFSVEDQRFVQYGEPFYQTYLGCVYGRYGKRNIIFGDTCYYNQDGTYIISRIGNCSIMAFSVSMIKKLNEYQQFIQECEEKEKTIIAEGKKLNSKLDNQISDRENAKSKKFLIKLKEAFASIFNSKEMAQKEVAIEKVKAIRELYFQNINRNTQIETSLNKNILSNYKNLYKSQQELPAFNTIEGAEQYEKKLVQTKELQDKFVSTSELYSTIEKKHVELENLCGKPYADVFKPYAAKYKTTMAVPKFESTNDISTYALQLESIKVDQQLRTDYINLRKEAEQLNVDILNLCNSAKNCKRLYMALYKELPMLWDESADNINIAMSNIQLLTSVKEKLSKQDLVELDKQLKKAKKVDEFKTTLRL